MTAFLYRGVPLEWHEAGCGLTPKGAKSEYVWAWGQEGHYWGEGTWGPSTLNGVIRHQLLKHPYDDSPFISTTPHFHLAEKYALYSCTEGIVYELDPARFDEHHVKVFKVREIVQLEKTLAAPEDDEHSLVATPPGPIPVAVIVRAIPVRRA